MSRQILNGWKEISGHIGRSVRTVQRWELRLGLPVYRPALKDRSAVAAFSDELDLWISCASPAQDEDVVLNSEIVLQVLKGMSSLVNDISGLASQMQLWPEPLPQPIEFYHTKTASRTGASAASVAIRGTGLVLAFRSWKAVLHSDSMVSRADVRGLIDEKGKSSRSARLDCESVESRLYTPLPGEKIRYKEVTDAIFLVHDTHQAVTRRVKPDEG
jgi:hypothetical protein